MDPGSDGDLCLSDEREREIEREREREREMSPHQMNQITEEEMKN